MFWEFFHQIFRLKVIYVVNRRIELLFTGVSQWAAIKILY